MKQFTVDRIEEDKVVLECENGDIVNLDKSSLPKNISKKIKEGDVLHFEENSFFLDKAETENRRKKIEALMDSVFED